MALPIDAARRTRVRENPLAESSRSSGQIEGYRGRWSSLSLLLGEERLQ